MDKQDDIDDTTAMAAAAAAADNQKRSRSDYEDDRDKIIRDDQHKDETNQPTEPGHVDESYTDIKKAKTDENTVVGLDKDSGISSDFDIDGMGGEKDMIEIAPDKVAHVIGSKGAIIQELQARTGAKIYVNQEFPPGVNRQVLISGSPAQVKTARELVNLILANGPTAIHENSLGGGPTLEIVIECPQSQVGKMIGPGGTTIKDLQAKSGAKIQIDQDFPDGVPRKIRVAGTQTAVTTATQLISVIMEGTSAPTTGYGQQRTSGGGGGQTIECAKSIVAKVIGRGGETIKSIQSRSGAKVQIEQNQDPCKIIINGAPQAIQMASQLINEVLGTAGGGYGQQAGMNYGNPYGYMMPSAGGYGQQQYPNAYAQNAAYGGYGGYGSVAAGAGGKGTWTRYETDDGIPFWHNAGTNESVWTKPE